MFMTSELHILNILLSKISDQRMWYMGECKNRTQTDGQVEHGNQPSSLANAIIVQCPWQSFAQSQAWCVHAFGKLHYPTG
jgi:hypothetical protein